MSTRSRAELQESVNEYRTRWEEAQGTLRARDKKIDDLHEELRDLQKAADHHLRGQQALHRQISRLQGWLEALFANNIIKKNPAEVMRAGDPPSVGHGPSPGGAITVDPEAFARAV